MNYYIESRLGAPHYNLALEQFVFDGLSRDRSYFMLWQNHNSIIAGKHQNTQVEINVEIAGCNNMTVEGGTIFR